MNIHMKYDVFNGKCTITGTAMGQHYCLQYKMLKKICKSFSCGGKTMHSGKL